MVDHIVHTSEPPGRVEGRRRRRWSEDVKEQIVAESFLPGAVASEVARLHGLSPQHLSAWRKAARAGLLRLPAEASSSVVAKGSLATTVQRACSSSSRQAAGALGRPRPGHEFLVHVRQ
jgi:transposase-like protein